MKAHRPLLELRDAGVRRGDHWLIRHIDITVRSGEIVTLIGPNGGGKTTTLRAALGIIALNEGRVWRQPGLRVGYVPQRLAIDPALPMTVRRFLQLGGAPAAAIGDELARAGVADCIDRPMRALSGGELQRVLIARALLNRPDLLVLDEPVQGVDFAGEADMYALIRAIREETGCGVLMASHDLHFVMQGTDEVVCVNGHVCCQGTPQAVRADPAYAALFGPAAVTAVAPYVHHHDHVHGVDGQIEPAQREGGDA
ncbi:MAG TPA: metal ABC transporter ATP-binding protein [Thermopetrobacter sp.]|nr:metal ABC transporter ATP-binding protein [Thermopetrobacter sp.]